MMKKLAIGLICLPLTSFAAPTPIYGEAYFVEEGQEKKHVMNIDYASRMNGELSRTHSLTLGYSYQFNSFLSAGAVATVGTSSLTEGAKNLEELGTEVSIAKRQMGVFGVVGITPIRGIAKTFSKYFYTNLTARAGIGQVRSTERISNETATNLSVMADISYSLKLNDNLAIGPILRYRHDFSAGNDAKDHIFGGLVLGIEL